MQGARACPLFWVKKEMTEGRGTRWASKIKPGPLLGSKSGSATVGSTHISVAELDFLALSAIFPSVISSIFTQNKGGGGGALP